MKLTAFTIIAMLALMGCHLLHRAKTSRHATSLPTSAPAPLIERSSAALPVPATPEMPVAQGQAPLLYVVHSTVPVRIVELDSGSVLASFNARPGNIISIDEQAGMHGAGELLLKGPLPAGRTYQIFLDEPSENEFRSERIRPGR
jgi:hypothetical protein